MAPCTENKIYFPLLLLYVKPDILSLVSCFDRCVSVEDWRAFGWFSPHKSLNIHVFLCPRYEPVFPPVIFFSRSRSFINSGISLNFNSFYSFKISFIVDTSRLLILCQFRVLNWKRLFSFFCAMPNIICGTYLKKKRKKITIIRAQSNLCATVFSVKCPLLGVQLLVSQTLDLRPFVSQFRGFAPDH